MSPNIHGKSAPEEHFPGIENHIPPKQKVNKKTALKVSSLIIGLLIIFYFIASLLAQNILRHSKTHSQAMLALQHNEDILAVLGEPVEEGGKVRGNIRFHEDQGESELNILLEGSLQDGHLLAEGILVGNQWSLT